jgi:hypothetical protein
MVRGNRCKHPLQQGAVGTLDDSFFRIPEVFKATRRLLVEVYWREWRIPSQPSVKHVPSNLQEPRTCITTLKTRIGSKGTQIRFLHNVFRLLRVASQMPRKIVNTVEMR